MVLAYENSGIMTTRSLDACPIYSLDPLFRAPHRGRWTRTAFEDPFLYYHRRLTQTLFNDVKHAWVERIARNALPPIVPFFLEFVTYEEGVDEKGLEFARKKPEYVTRSMEEFSKPQYGVDVLKVEVPINMRRQGARSCQRGIRLHARRSQGTFPQSACGRKKAIYYLSAGVSNDTFSETLELASETGVNFSGVLCGRATWKDGMPIYAKQGAKALEDWLQDQGVKNINNVNDRLKTAKPWFSFYGVTSSSALS